MEKKYKLQVRETKKAILVSFLFGLIIGSVVLVLKKNWTYSIATITLTTLIILVSYVFKRILDESARIRRFEEVFPDFLQLMSSNLRGGMTVDRAILMSSRPEFAPLDEEILYVGKDLATGKSVEKALLDMSARINSEKIKKTILLVISGISTGGDIAILLEQTAVNMRERGFVEKKASSSVLMYVIFIFLSVSIFAPFLFSLSTVLVEVLTKILGTLPDVQANVNLPFTLSKVNISTDFIKYFSIVFMIVVDIFASLVLGLVNKGEEKEGLKFLPVIVASSIAIFFLARIFVLRFLSGLL